MQLRAGMAPAGTLAAARPVLAGSRPATTQCTKSSASRSVKARASSLVSAGTPDHETAGDVLAPRHVYWLSIAAPSAHGVVMVMPAPLLTPALSPPPGCTAAAVVVGAWVVVVMIERVWFGRAGRRLRPSWEQAVSATTPMMARTATAVRLGPGRVTPRTIGQPGAADPAPTLRTGEPDGP